jgi:8-oxo-dGTP diphosphatase
MAKDPSKEEAQPVPMDLDVVSSPGWQAVHHATLTFVVCDDRILLIRKKRGLGAGKINGPGGKLDPGETPEQAAIRETQEELHVRPTGIEEAGELRFQFADGYSIYVHVFRASGCEGEPTETVEAIPIWSSLDSIPYDEMWEDDRMWIPMMLRGERFEGAFLFDGDSMLEHRLHRTG